MKTEKKRTLKGSVLFTVVSVLSLMVIFMTSALALAAAANKRAHRTYSTSQATYTARAAIDSILAAVGTDNEFAKQIDAIASGGSVDVDVNINDPALGRITKATVAYGGKTKIFDPTSKKWVDKNILDITAEVTLGGETSTIISHVIQDPVVKSEDGPGYLSMGGEGAFEKNQKSVWGGAYYGMGYGPNYDKDNNKTSWQSLTYFDWQPGDASLGLDPSFVKLDDKKYLTGLTFEADTGTNRMEAPVVYNSNLQFCGGTQVIVFTQPGKGLQVWGDLAKTGNGGLELSYEGYLGDTAKQPASLKFNQVPYIYVDGKFSIPEPGIKADTKGYPINIFCDTMDVTGPFSDIPANIYCFDQKGTSNFSGDSAGSLYRWANSIDNGTQDYSLANGNLYSKGNLHFAKTAGFVVNGDLCCEGNLTIESGTKLTVTGNLVVQGVLTNKGTLTADANKMYLNSAGGKNFTSTGGSMKADVSKKSFKQVFAANVDNKHFAWVSEELVKKYPTATKKEQTLSDGSSKADAIDFDGITIKDEDKDLILEQEHWINLEQLKQKQQDKDKNPIVKYYKKDAAGNEMEISVANAFSNADIKFENKDVKKVSDYIAAREHVYPAYAEKHMVLGLIGPIKGTEGHYEPTNTYHAESGNKVYDSTIPVGGVTESCTLTGKFDQTVKVKCTDKDIFIHLKDVDFSNTADDKKARFEVTESGEGRVYFTFEGNVKCNYNNVDDKNNFQVVQTVQEVMTTWGIESNTRNPQGSIKFDRYFFNEDGKIKTYKDASMNEKVEVENSNTGNNVYIENNTLYVPSILGDVAIMNGWDVNNIEIEPPAAGERWVQLDNFHLTGPQRDADCKFIVNDWDDGSKKQTGGTVNYFINGEMKVNKLYMTTKSFEEAFKDKTHEYQAITESNNPNLLRAGALFLPTPRVNIYSPMEDGQKVDTNKADNGQPWDDYYQKDSKITCTNSAFFCAYVRAPKLSVNVNNFTENYNEMLKRFYYNGALVNGTRLGVIGCFNVQSVESQNDWTLIYLRQGVNGSNPGPVTGANGAHKYASVSYTSY